MNNHLALALGLTLPLFAAAARAAAPVVSNVTFAQRAGTKLVDISYDVTAGTPTVFVSLEISSDGGTNFIVSAATGSGAIGAGVAFGTAKAITWDAGADWSGQYSTQMRFKVTATESPAGMSLIPAGAFTMGDSLDGDWAAPPHQVNVSAFFMGQKEVSKAEWDAVKAWAVSHGYTDLRDGAGKATSHPVQTLAWWDVIKWCNARSEKVGLTPCYTVSGAVLRTGSAAPTVNWTANGYRLPTEAEWEKAARGGLSGKRFPWGDTISHTQANYYSSDGYSYDISPTRGYHPTYDTGNYPYTSPVGSLTANGYGLQDMAGNILEWCWDWHGDYSSGEQTDPRGSSTGEHRVVRGGSYLSDAYSSRAAYRYELDPAGSVSSSVGFRLARSSVPAADAGSGYAVSADGGVDTRYKLTSTSSTNGTISGVVADGMYLKGTTATLTAVPEAGYAFTGWTGTASGIVNPLSLLMNGDRTIGATFVRQYTLTSITPTNGTITGVVADGKYLTGTTATLTAVPAAGYVFTGWTGAVSGTVNPVSLLMDEDKAIGATFTRQYTLTASAVNNGTIGGIVAGGKYLIGTTATLTAVPATGYAFTGWTGAASGTSNPLSLLMDANKTIGANFTRQYTLTSGTATNGTINGIVAGGKYLTGTMAELTAVPNPGYAFTGWIGAASGTANPLSLLMNSDKTIGAIFTRQYTLTIDPLVNGTITGMTADGKYLTGTTATLTAVPAHGYAFTGWTGAASGAANPLSLPMNGDQAIGATFTRQYTLTSDPLSNGTITGMATGGNYLTGTFATLSAVPDPGYAFTGWTGAASGTSNPLLLLMDTDKTIGATFTREYVLTITVPANGTVTGMAAGGKYLTGTTAELTAIQHPGYLFTGWTGDATGTANPLIILMNSDKSLDATFGPDLADEDGDHLSNFEEIVFYGTDPERGDTDGDGLTDAWELGLGRFSLVTGSFVWEQARDEAVARGGRLASFSTEEAWKRAIQSIGPDALDNFTGVWIGATDSLVDGVWTWQNGEPFGYSNWATSRPSTTVGNSLDFVEVSGGDGGEIWKWYDRGAATVRGGYILERGFNTNPLLADTDFDGLSDGEENRRETNPLLTDTDGDGYWDGAEVEFDGDPLNQQKLPEWKASLHASTGDGEPFEIRFPTVAGHTYVIEVSVDLSQWAILQEGIMGTGAVASRSVSQENQSKRYFRVLRN